MENIKNTQIERVNNINNTSLINGLNLDSVSEVMNKIRTFQAIISKTLIKDTDYGLIPGTQNPSLWKPGAEKILMIMGLTSEYIIEEKIQDYLKGFFAFTVKCVLSKNGIKITEGYGHANTKEKKHSERWVTEKKLPEGMNPDNLEFKEMNGNYGPYKLYKIMNMDTFTLVNTVLKMAKKRAQVDATLTVGALSDIFTQDFEDFTLIEPNKTPVSQPVKNVNSNGNKISKSPSQKQIGYYENLCKKLSLNGIEALVYASGTLGRKISSINDMTGTDISAVIDALRKEEPKNISPDCNELDEAFINSMENEIPAPF